MFHVLVKQPSCLSIKEDSPSSICNKNEIKSLKNFNVTQA